MKEIRYYFLLFYLLSLSINAQPIYLNEFMSKNLSILADEDGQYNDWIELYNSGTQVVNLKGYGLSDDKMLSMKWVFPDAFIAPHSFMYVFASGKDKKTTCSYSAAYWETIIDRGDDWQYFLENTEPPSNWRDTDFDDSGWRTGPSGFGYGDNDDSTVLSNTISMMVRHTFEISDITEITAGMLHVDYDDSFVAYLNGVEIARANIGQAGDIPAYNQLATTDREATIYTGGLPVYFEIKNLMQVLRQGKNVLAIEVHNNSTTSSDMTLIPFFTLGFNQMPVNQPRISKYVLSSLGNLHTNFKISASGEKIYFSDPSGHGLDTLFSVYLPANISYGRKPDGSKSWTYFATPSPGASNDNNIEYSAKTDSVSASPAGGFYNSSVSVSLSSKTADVKIYYTLDGADPTINSNIYTSPIQISSTTVLRARTFSDTSLPGNITTKTYLINEDLHLPVISITTDPPNLWDEDTGIYVFGKNYTNSEPYFGANFWQDWEKPAHIEFFETDGRTVINQDIGIKIYGTWSRAHPQRSFQLIARDKYGKSKFKYKIFPDINIDEFKSFILRNGGNDFGNELIRDEIMQRTIRDNTDIDNQEYRPADVFLNGQYWGIYNVREKISEDYIAAHHYANPDSIDLLEFGDGSGSPPLVINGSNEEYNSMINYISANSLSNSLNYEYIKSLIDINNFMNYEIAEIYFNNTDWPGNNSKFWRCKNPVTRWRWIFFGAEFGLGLYNTSPANNSLEAATAANGSSWPNPPYSTFLLRSLLENNDFKNEFLSRFADHINITFDPGRVQDIIDKLKSEIEPDMPRNIEKWNRNTDERNDGYTSFEDWIYGFDYINNFVQERPDYVRSHIVAKFGLKGTYKLSYNIQPTGSGNIKTSNLLVPEEKWTGAYFKNIPVNVTAIPKPGYRFIGWSGASRDTNASVILNFSSNQSLTANFKIAKADTNKIVINEINYNSAKGHDSEDWIEIFNNNDASINLSAWKIKGSDSANVYTLPQNTVLAANGYLVVCRNKKKFTGFFPSVDNAEGDFGFGFSSGGENVLLLDPNGKTVDSVKYNNKLPWPVEADGNGPTLELKSPELDNSIAGNWAASTKNFGTPGGLNSCITPTGIEEKDQLLKNFTYRLEQNYPNPFNPVTKIRYSIPKTEHVKISVYDLLGREVAILVDEFKNPGNYEVEFNVRNMSSGVYFYRMQSGSFVNTKKLIVTK